MFLKQENLHSLIAAAAMMFVFVWSQIQKHEGAVNVVTAWSDTCEFPAPGDLRDGPFPKANLWCEDADKQPMVNLMNHMRVHCDHLPGCIASEVGVDRIVGYRKSLNLFLINVRITSISPDVLMITCTNSVGGIMVVKRRPYKVEAEFISQNFKKTTMVFTNNDACAVQAMIEGMNELKSQS